MCCKLFCTVLLTLCSMLYGVIYSVMDIKNSLTTQQSYDYIKKNNMVEERTIDKTNDICNSVIAIYILHVTTILMFCGSLYFATEHFKYKKTRYQNNYTRYLQNPDYDFNHQQDLNEYASLLFEGALLIILVNTLVMTPMTFSFIYNDSDWYTGKNTVTYPYIKNMFQHESQSDSCWDNCMSAIVSTTINHVLFVIYVIYYLYGCGFSWVLF